VRHFTGSSVHPEAVLARASGCTSRSGGPLLWSCDPVPAPIGHPLDSDGSRAHIGRMPRSEAERPRTVGASNDGGADASSVAGIRAPSTIRCCATASPSSSSSLSSSAVPSQTQPATPAVTPSLTPAQPTPPVVIKLDPSAASARSLILDRFEGRRIRRPTSCSPARLSSSPFD
jgi:hypothetical protein